MIQGALYETRKRGIGLFILLAARSAIATVPMRRASQGRGSRRFLSDRSSCRRNNWMDVPQIPWPQLEVTGPVGVLPWSGPPIRPVGVWPIDTFARTASWHACCCAANRAQRRDENGPTTTISVRAAMWSAQAGSRFGCQWSVKRGQTVRCPVSAGKQAAPKKSGSKLPQSTWLPCSSRGPSSNRFDKAVILTGERSGIGFRLLIVPRRNAALCTSLDTERAQLDGQRRGLVKGQPKGIRRVVGSGTDD